MDGVISRKLEKSSFQLSQRICADTGLLRSLQSKIGFMVFEHKLTESQHNYILLGEQFP